MHAVKINPEFIGRGQPYDDVAFRIDDNCVVVDKPGRGEWRAVDSVIAGDTFFGYDGEAVIRLAMMTMQDRSWNVVATLSRVNNPLVVLHSSGQLERDTVLDPMLNTAVTLLDRLANYGG